MRVLDVQERIKLIEVSKDWAEKTVTSASGDTKRELYLKSFDNIYEQLAKTTSGK